MSKGIQGRGVCKFEGCDRPVKTRGLCGGHHQQQAAGRELRPLQQRWPRGLSCSICGKPAEGRGLCLAHYKKLRKYGDPTVVVIAHYEPGTLCAYEGCDRGVVAKGYCNQHRNQQKAGKPLQPIKPILPPKERLLAARVIDDNGCWLWPGYVGPEGYGRSRFDGSKTVLVHRAAYELWVGPVGRSAVHHKCAVRRCFNPEHLELATQRENTLEMLERRALKGRIAELEAQVRELEAMLNVASTSDPHSSGVAS